ncbi:hypothetical protein [Clostridium muellerianum]|nr:hypothetical protein [Clostridium muellerianum]
MDYQKAEDSVLKSAMDFFGQSVVSFFGIFDFQYEKRISRSFSVK